MKSILSVQNSFIREVLKLQEKSRERRKKGLFLVEGIREVSLAIKGGYEVTYLLFCKDYISIQQLNNLQTEQTNLITVSKQVYKKIAYRESTEGVMAILKLKDFCLNKIQFKSKNPLVLVAEAPEKPGNIGALLRTADAANIDAVFIANPKTDLYNPNIIRSSIGCLFTNQIAIGTSEEIIHFLKEKNISIYSATLQNSNLYHQENYTKPCAIVVGTEATGLTQIWRDNATQNIHIPMQGDIDSMNVSVAAAIVIFEAKRQRNFN